MALTQASRTRNLRAQFESRFPAKCMLSGKTKRVILAHILPHSAKADVQQSLEMFDKVDDDRNLLWLCPNLERAFDRMEISFVPESVLSRRLKLHVWNKAILDNRLWYGEVDTSGKRIIKKSKDRIRDFVGKCLTCPNDPFRRCLSYQAFFAYWHWRRQSGDTAEIKIPDSFDDSDYAGTFKISQRNEYISQFFSDAKAELAVDIDSEQE